MRRKRITMHKGLYSIRMRASLNGKHVSGAERIVAFDKIDVVLRELVSRALGKGASPDEIVLKLERLEDRPLRSLSALDVITLNAPDPQTGRSLAIRVLQKAGVPQHAAASAIDCLCRGASASGGNMRGAVLMDAQSGERLEPDQERGVRASRFDWSGAAYEEINRRLAAVGLTHHRTREALALATKVAHAPGIVAELCWSDEPDYTAGYAASRKTGYVRFPFLKEPGDDRGGRVFFVDRKEADIDVITRYLETEAVMITALGKCGGVMEPLEYFSQG